MSADKYEKVAQTTAIWLLMLGGWFLLCFIGGIDYLVTPWRIEHGVWFWVSLGLLLHVFAASLVCWYKLRWSHYFVLTLTGSWLVVQFLSHWIRFIRPPEDASAIERYYAHFQTWYLIPQISDRIVPDGYHTILAALLLVCFFQGIRALLISMRSP